MNTANGLERPLNHEAAALSNSDKELDEAIKQLRDAASNASTSQTSHLKATSSKHRVSMQILVEVNIVLGSAEMSVGELTELQDGSTIQLNKRIGDPVDVVVNGIKIARGDLTLLESDTSRFGLRITELF